MSMEVMERPHEHLTKSSPTPCRRPPLPVYDLVSAAQDALWERQGPAGRLRCDETQGSRSRNRHSQRCIRTAHYIWSGKLCLETEIPRNGLRPPPLMSNTWLAETDRQQAET